MQIDSARGRVTAVLGPTNTGKTHHAMERMLGHAGGMIGFPLRLLARENYDRAVAAKGVHQVALITGEEKIVPPNPRYFLCTVEAMPTDRPVPFLGIDEIQMCADPDRGHVFCDRLLNARGTDETMFMGADTMAPLLRRLVPEVEIVSRPRFSTLSYAGSCKLTRLPRRSVAVAFSATDVYTIAELVRRQRGGAAVVLGALSPRTRNAQVALYQAGEVDHLVATDAIGMGLNMDVDHVAFAQLRKFDGRMPRHLTPPEMAQIAGRAGRHMNDGTFGVTAEVEELDPQLVERLENHRFDPLKAIFWRNAHLDTSSISALQASLARRPETPGLMRARLADDELALAALARDGEIVARATTPDRVALLWDVCRIPDFQKVVSDSHTRMLTTIFEFLSSPDGRLPTDWLAEQVSRCDKTEGEIDHLVQRIARIRTWTYVSHRGDWVADSAHWQETTRAVEDRLSDALHARLTQKFIDRRTAVLSRRLKDEDSLDAAIAGDGRVLVEGHYVGRLDGFRFDADEASGSLARRTLSGAALKALQGEISRRMARLERDEDKFFDLKPDATVTWRAMPVARLAAGDTPFKPRVEPLDTDLLEPVQRERLRFRLETWAHAHIRTKLDPLPRLAEADLPASARGIAFQVAERLGTLPRRAAAEQVAALERDDRRLLRELGVRFGREAVYVPMLLKPTAVNLRALLWKLANGGDHPTPADGRMSVPIDSAVPKAFYEAIGYRPLGALAVRDDMVERIAGKAWDLAHESTEGEKGEFSITPDLLSLAGCSVEVMAGILHALGYRSREVPAEPPAPEPASLRAPDPETTPDPETAAALEGGENQGGGESREGGETAEAAPPDPSPAPEAEAEDVPAETPAAPADGPPREVPCAPKTPKLLFRFHHRRPKSDRPPRPERREDRGAPGIEKRPRKGRSPAVEKSKQESGPARVKRPAKPGASAPPPKREKEIDPDSPFAVLKDLLK